MLSYLILKNLKRALESIYGKNKITIDISINYVE